MFETVDAIIGVMELNNVLLYTCKCSYCTHMRALSAHVLCMDCY